jgi:hypothetical protein
MSTVHITLDRLNPHASNRIALGMVDAQPGFAETITGNSSASQQAGITVPGNFDTNFYVWTITALGQNVWINFGDDPTAAAGSGRLIPAGVTRAFSATAAGEKIAVRDVA